METVNKPPTIVKRVELAKGNMIDLGAHDQKHLDLGGGILKMSDGSYGLQITYRSPGDQHVLDTETHPLAGNALEASLTKLGLDKNLNPLGSKK